LKPVNWFQLFNAVCGAAAAAIWFVAIGTTMRIAGKVAVASTCVAFAVSSWYAVIYFSLGTGLLDIPLLQAVPLFRYAFAFLILAGPFRYLALRSQAEALAGTIRIANELKQGPNVRD